MAKQFFTPEEQQEIVQAIAQAESNTSGEIRVHIESYCRGNALQHATKLFHKLEMHKTLKRNGVLFYVAVKSHKVAIVGDEGIHQHVKQNFWDNLAKEIVSFFAQNKYKEGLIVGISAAGEKLKERFPREDGDVNELPDEISFGK